MIRCQATVVLALPATFYEFIGVMSGWAHRSRSNPWRHVHFPVELRLHWHSSSKLSWPVFFIFIACMRVEMKRWSCCRYFGLIEMPLLACRPAKLHSVISSTRCLLQKYTQNHPWLHVHYYSSEFLVTFDANEHSWSHLRFEMHIKEKHVRAVRWIMHVHREIGTRTNDACFKNRIKPSLMLARFGSVSR